MILPKFPTALSAYDPLVRTVQDLPAQVLRFPGGEASYFYDWEKEGLVEASKRHKPGLYTGGRLEGKKARLADFLTLVDAVREKPTLVLPVYNFDSAYNIALLERLKTTHGAEKFPLFELGNEHGGTAEWKQNLKTWGEYVVRSDSIGKAVLKEFPQSLVGATALPTDTRHATEWNQALAAANARSRFFNAVVFHRYLIVRPRHLWSDYLTRMQYLFGSSEAAVRSITRLGTTHFPGLPLLITEIGVRFPERADPLEYRYWGTELAGLDYWLQWLVASQQGHPVKTVLRHMLVSQVGPESVLHWTAAQTTTPGVTYGWAYYTHAMLQQLLTRFSSGEFSAHPFPQLPLKSGATIGDPHLPYSPVLAFVFRKGEESGFLVLNKDAAGHVIELPSGPWNITTLSANPRTVGSQLAADPRARTTVERQFDSAPYSVTIGVKAP